MDKEKREFPWIKNYDKHVSHSIEYPDLTINQLFEQAIKNYSGNIFLQFEDSSFTYEEIGEKVNAFKNFLLTRGIKKGDRIGLALPNIPQFIISFYGILATGAVVVAMNPRYTTSEFETLVKKSGVRTIICLDNQKELFQTIAKNNNISHIVLTSIEDISDIGRGKINKGEKKSGEINFLQALQINGSRYDDVRCQIDPDDPAIFQFSGGTTGTPKPAVGTHRNLVVNSIQFSNWCHLSEGEEVILAVLPLYHVYGMVLAMNMGIAIGAKIVLIPDPRNIENILSSIEDLKVTFYPGVPTMYHAINEYISNTNKDYDLRSIKACISGSFTLHPEIKRKFEDITGGKLMEGYGLSEAPTATHCNPLMGKNKEGSIGMPLPDIDAKIVDIETGKVDLDIGEIGELIIRGQTVMMGYYNQPEETDRALRNGWLYTGDIAKMDADGYFYLVDRKKSLIKVNGLQVWPNEVENVINLHPDVKASGIGGVPDHEHGEKIICWVVLEDGKIFDENEMVLWCKRKISGYKIPKEFIILDKLPRTSVGKILRRKLIDSYNKKSADS